MMAIGDITLLALYNGVEEWANSDPKHKAWAIKNYGKNYVDNLEFIDDEPETLEKYYSKQKGCYTIIPERETYEIGVYEMGKCK